MADAEKVYADVEKQLMGEYEIKIPKTFNPSIRIHGVKEKLLEEEELIQGNKQQNPGLLSDSEVKVFINKRSEKFFLCYLLVLQLSRDIDGG